MGRCVGDFCAEYGWSSITGRGGVSIFRDVFFFVCTIFFQTCFPCPSCPSLALWLYLILFHHLLRVCSPSGAGCRWLGRARRGVQCCTNLVRGSQQSAPHPVPTGDAQVCQHVGRCVGDFRAECGGSCVAGRDVGAKDRFPCGVLCSFFRGGGGRVNRWDGAGSVTIL